MKNVYVLMSVMEDEDNEIVSSYVHSVFSSFRALRDFVLSLGVSTLSIHDERQYVLVSVSSEGFSHFLRFFKFQVL